MPIEQLCALINHRYHHGIAEESFPRVALASESTARHPRTVSDQSELWLGDLPPALPVASECAAYVAYLTSSYNSKDHDHLLPLALDRSSFILIDSQRKGKSCIATIPARFSS
jgi:hypothetical protein